MKPCVVGQPWLVTRISPGCSLTTPPQQHMGRKFNEKLICLGKVVEIYHQLLSQAKHIQLGED